MKFLKNYQNALKGKHCDHVFSILDEKQGFVIRKCIRCFRIFEYGVDDYEN